MTGGVYLPTDEFTGGVPDLDLAADYLELVAFLSEDRQSFGQDIVDALEQASDGDFDDVDHEIRHRETISTGAVNRIAFRKRILKKSYPFRVDRGGDVVSFETGDLSFGQAAYLLSLVLSNLTTITPVLSGSDREPTSKQVAQMRIHFQYFATAALAAEVVGPAWSFGHPRPDGTGFLKKLKAIWATIKDGRVEPRGSAPTRPQDDQVDVFARREQRDELPGFVLAAAQVATGKNWREKSILAHATKGFYGRWFSQEPVTRLVPFHVIPFNCSDVEMEDHVLNLGNVLHRLRVPHRVDEAEELVKRNVPVEAYDKLGEAVDLICSLRMPSESGELQ